MRPAKSEVMAWLKPEPATEEELAELEKLAPGDYEVYSERLAMILSEVKEVFMRVGISFMLHAGDLVVGLHTAQGDVADACLGTFLHTVTAQLPIKWVLRNFKDNPRVGIREGDIFYASESTYGGIHGADQIAFMPIFFKGELIAWASAGVHLNETGGCEPGGMMATAKSRYDEGMNLTPIKIAENYQLRDDLVEMTVNMISRAPRQQAIDLRARVTAVDRLRIRIQQLAEQKGGSFVRGLLRKMLMVAEEGARQRIRRWNDGIYRSVAFVDTIGRGRGLWRIFVTAYKEGDHILFDYTGTSPENDSAWNAMPWVAVCYAAQHMYAHGFYDLPACAGALAPLDWHMPEGCLVSPNFDAAISSAVLVGEVQLKIFPQLFARMMFSSEDRLESAAPIAMSQTGSMLSGVNQWGVPYADMPTWVLNTQGQGARVDMDGMNSSFFPSSLHAFGADAEESEVNLPVLHLWQKHLKDSPGPGKYRGGASGHLAYLVYGAPFVIRVFIAHTGRIPCGQGLFGGYPPNNFPFVGIEKANALELLAKGTKNFPQSVQELVKERVVSGEYRIQTSVGPSDLMTEGALITAGGGAGHGYGDVLERDPQAVVDDVRNEIISDWSARNIYHVAYDHEMWAVDEKETERLRKLERKNRLRRAKSYTEFEKEWLKKKPPDDELKYYGSWPDARIVRPLIRI